MQNLETPYDNIILRVGRPAVCGAHKHHTSSKILMFKKLST